MKAGCFEYNYVFEILIIEIQNKATDFGKFCIFVGQLEKFQSLSNAVW